MKNHILILLFLTVFVSAFSQNKTVYKTISTQDMESVINDRSIQLIDVRTEQEYHSGHIAHAKNINFYKTERFTTEVSKLDRNKPVYLYCHIGGRSQRASAILTEMGFKEIYDYSGGWQAWLTK